MITSKYSFAIILRVLIGVIFITSALTKLFSIDSFEVYVFSLNVFNLNISFILARILIAFELLLGAYFILGLYFKFVWYSTVGMLLGFTVFLIISILNNSQEHCHCFGDSVQLSNGASIVKNIILLIFLFLLRKITLTTFRFKHIIAISIFLASVAVPFIISPPDTFSLDLYKSRSEYNNAALKNFLEKETEMPRKQIICFFGAGCRFCKLSARKLSAIYKKTDNTVPIRYIFWGGEEEISKFFAQPNTIKPEYKTMAGDSLLTITNGHMPLIILLENKTVVKRYSYRDINDAEILEFMQK